MQLWIELVNGKLGFPWLPQVSGYPVVGGFPVRYVSSCHPWTQQSISLTSFWISTFADQPPYQRILFCFVKGSKTDRRPWNGWRGGALVEVTWNSHYQTGSLLTRVHIFYRVAVGMRWIADAFIHCTALEHSTSTSTIHLAALLIKGICKIIPDSWSIFI